jgi:twinkle protein
MEKSKYETEDSEFLHHGPCPSCGSRNNLGVYSDHSYCFGCEYYAKGHGQGGGVSKKKPIKQGLIPEGEYVNIKGRGILQSTARKFRYSWGHYQNRGVYVATYCDSDGNPVAQKLRDKDKRFKFIWSGRGKKVVITEGEIDAMSVSQVQDNKWPVVSVPNGAAGAKKALKKQLEWLEGYETIVLMFDEDEPGRKAAKECASLFTPGKAFIAKLPMKDPNEMLVAGRGPEIIKAMWEARPYNPDGIISGADTWELLTAKETTRAIPTPWTSVNELTHGGFRTSEITMVCAGTGIGKSQLCRQFAWNALKNGERVAYIALEETVKRSVQGILSLEVGRPLHLESDMKQKEVQDAWEHTIRDSPIYFYDHWGSADSDGLINKIRYLAKGCDVTTVILDHISIIVSDIEGGDERRIIDNMMTKFAGLVLELGIALVLVCHVRKSQGKSFEEGGQIGLDDLRGSGSLKQLSWTVVGLERDQQGKDPNVATVRILKNRTVGETGVAGKIVYDAKTTLLNEYDDTFDNGDDDEEEI